jgi:hypothetical protein
MKKISYIVLILFFLSCGMLIFALTRGWIVIKFPEKYNYAQNYSTLPMGKKSVKLYFWHNNKWQHETVQLIWSQDQSKNLEYLINNWLSLLDEEQIIDKKVELQAALLTQSNYCYLSFDRSLFGKESTTHEKLLIVQGLFKTIKENGINLQGIHFLVQHQPMIDAHLDFSNPWPLSGFVGE